jgi:hypothetical protein
MDGAKGIYPWIPVSYDSYEYFIYGLYRLSEYSYLFDGNQTIVIPEPAHYSFVNQTPIWRGVVNGDEILIAAHNPFAGPIDTTFIPVSYNEWSETIAVVGKETFLCKFDMDITNSNRIEMPDVSINVFPNPSQGRIVIEGDLTDCSLTISEPCGRIVFQIENEDLPTSMDMNDLSKGLYVLKIESRDLDKPKIVKLLRN